LQPDTELAGRKEAEEKNKLATIKASLSQEEKEEIIEAAARLLERQNHEDDASILPKVGLDDIPKTISEPRVMSLGAKDKKIKMSYYPSPTNGIAYQHIVYSLPHLSEEQKSLLPLFTSCITELGINDLSYKATQELQAQISGGINCHASIRAKYNDIQEIASALTFSSKYLNANHASVSKLLHSTIQNVRFEETELTSNRCNARMSHSQIRKHCEINKEQGDLLQQAMEQLSLSARAYDRILKVARTIADLAGTEQIETAHLLEAIQYRSLDRNLFY